MDVSPATANPSIRDIQLAIEKQFGNEALPVAITFTCFRTDFVIQFATPHEGDTVASLETLEGEGFDMLLIRWSKR
jgi:hypothetical protein